MNPLLLCDFYKTDHRRQYPEGTTLVYSNFTPRTSRIPGVDKVVFFGLQYFIKKYLIASWKRFFEIYTKDVAEYDAIMLDSMGFTNSEHWKDLEKLGYLPLEIKALPEGSRVPLKVPMLTIKNTHPDFFWLTNYIESLMSAILWGSCTSATIAYEYRKLLAQYADDTGADKAWLDWQAHDFSLRGMYGLEAATLSGGAHLLSFKGTDSVPSIDFLKRYYGADSDALIGGSVPATEHSVMCSYGQENELECFRRLLTEVYPTGVVSIVSDTWDLWKVITEYLPQLKELIMARDGKLVIRPDSGDPVDIICGKGHFAGVLDLNLSVQEIKGTIELLWDIFGGTFNEKGYKVLDPHIGVIYGEGITLDRANEICCRLMSKGFASSNITFGIGSYTYQYNTRDTFGFAMKATYIEINGQGKEIFKDPATDDGTKKSAKGLLAVHEKFNNGSPIYILEDQMTREEEVLGALETVFKNGKLIKETTLTKIRGILHANT